MSFDRIPLELRELNQWVVWKLEDIGAKKPTKIPYSAKTGRLASVTDEATWCDFRTACAAVNSSNYSGVGFVFTDDDPYTFIDLDDTNGNQVALDRQIKIYREFDSYAEISPSGKGLHIIIRGNVPSGRRRAHIEIYSTGRYATFTGHVYNDKPIAERQETLIQLWEQMGAGGAATTLYRGDDSERHTDEEVLEQARNAANHSKFNDLFEGRWENHYPSQSEADYSIINIITFFTKNKIQITRIFRLSALGKRAKANRVDYIDKMINHAFDRELPQLDFDGFDNALENKKASIAQLVVPVPHKNSDVGSIPTASTIPIPEGLLGELAQFIYQAAPRPVPEIALAGAIGLMSGICGRAYNVSGTGLNQYIMLIAATGTGKEAMASGIDRLMDAIRFQVPTAHTFLGPSEIASGQALIKHLSKNSQCFVSVLGEFGLRLQQMSSSHANSAEIGLRRMLLDLYNKSGAGQVARPMIYADRDKNTDAINSPAFSILGESTPERFYGALNEEMISEGLLPRFMLIEYDGPRPPLSDHHSTAIPPFQLIERFAGLVANVEQIQHSNRTVNIEFSEEALKISKDFDKYADAQINGTNQEVVRQLWNRAHIKALKMAGLIAIGVNPFNPKMEDRHLYMAINMVHRDIQVLTKRFEAGEIGTTSSEQKQISEVKRIIKEFITSDYSRVSKYKVHQGMHHAKIIPYQYLTGRLFQMAAFRNDLKTGATGALKRAIQNLVDGDKIREVNKAQLAEKFNTTQRAFIVSDPSILD